eukprot:3211058-Amphidinium_carterae.1
MPESKEEALEAVKSVMEVSPFQFDPPPQVCICTFKGGETHLRTTSYSHTLLSHHTQKQPTEQAGYQIPQSKIILDKAKCNKPVEHTLKADDGIAHTNICTNAMTIRADGAFGTAGDEVVIEQLLIGEECSCMAFCDGKKVAMMVPAQELHANEQQGIGKEWRTSVHRYLGQAGCHSLILISFELL